MIIFIVDDMLNIVYKKRVMKYKLDNIIVKGLVVKKVEFMDSFLKIIKKEKIKTSLFNSTITIVKNSFFKVSDLYYLENIFFELGYLKIKFLDIRTFLIDSDASFIEINNTYMVIHDFEGLYIDLMYFRDVKQVILFLENDLKDNIILFGVNKNILNIKGLNKNIYYYENYDSYIIDNLLKNQ